MHTGYRPSTDLRTAVDLSPLANTSPVRNLYFPVSSHRAYQIGELHVNPRGSVWQRVHANVIYCRYSIRLRQNGDAPRCSIMNFSLHFVDVLADER